MKISREDLQLIVDCRKMREELRWSQERLAREIGISRQLISSIENFRERPSKKIQGQLAYLLYTHTLGNRALQAF